jgi:hypothetical protein
MEIFCCAARQIKNIISNVLISTIHQMKKYFIFSENHIDFFFGKQSIIPSMTKSILTSDRLRKVLLLGRNNTSLKSSLMSLSILGMMTVKCSDPWQRVLIRFSFPRWCLAGSQLSIHFGTKRVYAGFQKTSLFSPPLKSVWRVFQDRLLLFTLWLLTDLKIFRGDNYQIIRW